jgi:phosphate/sulfate permease
MIGDFLRLAVGEATLHVRGLFAGAALALATGVFFLVAIGFGTAAVYTALTPELGAAWTAAVIGAAFLAFGLVALAANTVVRRRRVVRQLAMARTRQAMTPTMSPEMLLLAAAAGALFSFGSNRRPR